MNFPQSDRLQNLPAYIFSEINKFKAAATAKGISLTSLAIGDPDRPTPPKILEKIVEALHKGSNHLYSPYEGSAEFRQSVSRFMEKRFGVKVDANKEVMALIGSKEGIAHFPVAFCNPGDKVLFPSPGYPVFQTACLLAGATALPFPHRAENKFQPDTNELRALLQEHRPKMMILNYPSNPTTVTVSRETLTEVVRLAREFNTIVVYDNAYSEMYYDSKERPLSILEIPGAMDVAIEFQSLSKTFNMTGWRLGFAVGNEELVAGLTKTKTNIDSGPLLTVQEAGAYALDHSDELAEPIRDVYRERRAAVLKGLDSLGIEYLAPKATFFIWARVPNGQPSLEFCKSLIDQQGLVITPGMGFGPEGEGYFRLAMTVDVPRIEKAMSKLETYLKK